MKAYIMKIEMAGLGSPVWRRVIMPAGATFQRLHSLIQLVTNFQSEYMDFPAHFHEFRLPEENLLVTNEPEAYERAKKKKGEGPKVRKPQSTKIDGYLEKQGRLSYTYDFGDNWQFEVTLEEVVDDYHFGHPILLDGEGDAPPEDVGGAAGFEHLLMVLADKNHPDHEHLLWWSNEQHFRPYDRSWINSRLKDQKIKKTEWDKINHVNYQVVSDKYFVEEERSERNALPEGFDVDLFFRYVRACTNLYGVVPSQEVIAIFNRQNPHLYLNLGPAIKLIYEWQWLEKMKDSNVLKSGLEFVHARVEAAGIKESLLGQQDGKAWYVPEKEELLKYEDSDYVEKTAAYIGLRNVLKPHFPALHPVGVDGVIRTFAQDLQMDASFNNAFMRLVQTIDYGGMDTLDKIAQRAVFFSNNHRLWSNRGHAPLELSKREKGMPLPKQEYLVPSTSVIAGRNDPCPCGSGKKYKKCCGK